MLRISSQALRHRELWSQQAAISDQSQQRILLPWSVFLYIKSAARMCVIKILAPSDANTILKFTKDLKYLKDTLRIGLIKQKALI
jgi:hypothetical protein